MDVSESHLCADLEVQALDALVETSLEEPLLQAQVGRLSLSESMRCTWDAHFISDNFHDRILMSMATPRWLEALAPPVCPVRANMRRMARR